MCNCLLTDHSASILPFLRSSHHREAKESFVLKTTTSLYLKFITWHGEKFTDLMCAY